MRIPLFPRRAAVLLLLSVSGITVPGANAAQGNSCLPLTDAEKVKIVAYLSKWFGVPETEKLTIERDEIASDSCYRRLVVKSQTLRSTSFFLSPDQRFLTGSLLDLTGDPIQEKSQAQEEINKLLLLEPSPSRGTSTAPVTIVEFGDFECPFCKRLYEWTQQLASENDANFRIVFKHLPIDGHPWAQAAATFAICAETQSNDAFWQLHDFFFENQRTLNTANLQGRVIAYVADHPAIDGSRLLNCARSQEPAGRIIRDAGLAKQFRVSATPTIFVNGIRVTALQSQDELRSLVQRAAQNPTGGTK